MGTMYHGTLVGTNEKNRSGTEIHITNRRARRSRNCMARHMTRQTAGMPIQDQCGTAWRMNQR